MVISFFFIAVFFAIVLAVWALNANAKARQKRTSERLADIPAFGSATQLAADASELMLRPDSDVPAWLGALLQRLDILSRLQKLIETADSSWSVAKVVLFSMLTWAFVMALAYLRTNIWILSFVVACVSAIWPVLYLLHLRQRRLDKFEQLLPNALDLMVSSIRAGHGLLAAMGMVAREAAPPISVEFRKCFDEQNFGLELQVALEHLTERVPIHDVQIVVAAILIQKESGGNLAEVLEKAAYVTRERFRLKRQIRVHTAQGRLTGWILSLLPPILGVGLFLVNPSYMAHLWHNPIGVKLMYASAIMTVIGALIIRKIVNVRV